MEEKIHVYSDESNHDNQRLSETWNTSYSEQGIFFSPYDATYGALSENFGKS